MTILSRKRTIADNDRTVVSECVEIYGNFIRELTKRFTNSTEEAEAATRDIFIDLWKYAEKQFQSPDGR